MATETWQDENGVRTCPRCAATFDGTTIGATAQARILCSDCTLATLDERCAAEDRAALATQHTPGPWTRETGQRFREMVQPESAGVRGPNGNYVATALDFNRYDRDDEVEANARLIAAAPDLLKALEALVTEFGARLSDGKPVGHTVGSMDRALMLVIESEAAIAKAKGEVS